MNADIIFFQFKDELFYLADKFYTFRIENQTLTKPKIRNTNLTCSLLTNFRADTVGYLFLFEQDAFVQFYRSNEYQVFSNVSSSSASRTDEGKLDFLNNFTLIYVYQLNNESVQFLIENAEANFSTLKLNFNDFKLDSRDRIDFDQNQTNQCLNHLKFLVTGNEMNNLLNGKSKNKKFIRIKKQINTIKIKPFEYQSRRNVSKYKLIAKVNKNLTDLNSSINIDLGNFKNFTNSTQSPSTKLTESHVNRVYYYIYGALVIFFSILSLIALYFFKTYSEKNIDSGMFYH